MATIGQKAVFAQVKKQVRNGQRVSVSKAIRDTKMFSPSVETTPSKITETKGWQELMQEHLPELVIAERHRELLDAGTIGEYEFYAREEWTEESEENPDADIFSDAKKLYDESNGKLKVSQLQRSLSIGYARAARLMDLLNEGEIPEDETRSVKKKIPATDEEIKAIVESVPGCKLIYIKEYSTGSKVAYFQQPDNNSRRHAIDMAHKLRGTYAPEKTLNLNVSATVRNNPKVREIANKYEQELKRTLIDG